MIEKLLLIIHVLAGCLGLFIGPVAMFSRKTKGVHTQWGTVYHWLVFVVCVSAIPICFMNWERNWFLFFVALFSYWFAFEGYKSARDKKQGWLVKHIRGMLGSYIALVTALLVINASKVPGLNSLPAAIPWLIPTAVGIPIIRMVRAKYRLS